MILVFDLVTGFATSNCFVAPSKTKPDHYQRFHRSSIEVLPRNTNNFILDQIKNNKTLATSYLSMVNMYNIIQLFIIKINSKHYTY